MKTAVVFLTIGIILLTIVSFKTNAKFAASTVDIHVHDTVFVVPYFYISILSLLFLGTLFSIGGVIGTKFRGKIFIILFLLCAAACGYIIWKVNQAFNS